MKGSSRMATRDEIQSHLEDQIAHLTRQVASLTKAMSKRGAGAYSETRDDAAEFYGDMIERFSDALPAMSRQAHLARKTVNDNPVAAAVVGVAVLGLLFSLLSRR